MRKGLTVGTLEDMLNSFDPDERWESFSILFSMAKKGEIPISPTRSAVNLHFHTFFSFNAYGYSPSRIAWEAWKQGLLAAGIVDFDCLDGLTEFVRCSRLAGLRYVVSLETRVYIPDMFDKIFSSPNEPGISYFMGVGFVKEPDPSSSDYHIFSELRNLSERRNKEMMGRLNPYLEDIAIDYELDVKPLTPNGNVTERHMIKAYDMKSRRVLGKGRRFYKFWSEKLGVPEEEIRGIADNIPKFHNLIRSKLMKYGGVGYAPPEAGNFPNVRDFIKAVLNLGAIPTYAWLDGTGSGEENIEDLLDYMEWIGVRAFSIIPERNWNIKDPKEKGLKLRKFREAIDAVMRRDIPITIGTEMNAYGQRFVDDFDAPEMRKLVRPAIEGAMIFWGHTFMSETLGKGYLSEWADDLFGKDRKRRNEFYREVGKLAIPGNKAQEEAIRKLPKICGPEEIISTLRSFKGT